MILPHLSLDGTCASAVLDIGVAGARGHGQAKKRRGVPDAVERTPW